MDPRRPGRFLLGYRRASRAPPLSRLAAFPQLSPDDNPPSDLGFPFTSTILGVHGQ